MPLLVAAWAPAAALAAGAPASHTNALQRAAWACEGAAPALTKGSAARAGRPRFFLSGADLSARQADRPALVLSNRHLTGVGRLADARGWSNVRFDCTLSPNLRQARAFTFERLSPIPPPPAASAQAAPPGVAKAPAADKMRWFVTDAAHNGGRWQLVHGLAQSDDHDFLASCLAGSGTIQVPLTRTVEWLHPGGFATVGITDGPGSGLYIARGVVSADTGAAMPVLTLDAADPLLDWIAGGSSLLINLNGALVYEVALRGSGAAARRFSALCRA